MGAGYAHAQLAEHVQLFATPYGLAAVPLSGNSQAEYWNE